MPHKTWGLSWKVSSLYDRFGKYPVLAHQRRRQGRAVPQELPFSPSVPKPHRFFPLSTPSKKSLRVSVKPQESAVRKDGGTNGCPWRVTLARSSDSIFKEPPRPVAPQVGGSTPARPVQRTTQVDYPTNPGRPHFQCRVLVKGPTRRAVLGGNFFFRGLRLASLTQPTKWKVLPDSVRKLWEFSCFTWVTCGSCGVVGFRLPYQLVDYLPDGCGNYGKTRAQETLGAENVGS